MTSLLIKDTTREQREAIVAESIGYMESACDGASAGMADMYQDYIDGKRELREINAAYRSGYCSPDRRPERHGCGMG